MFILPLPVASSIYFVCGFITLDGLAATVLQWQLGLQQAEMWLPV